jgi:hypothetical protein
MSFIPSINYLYSLSGFAVGLLVGLTGVGGGSLMTPLLILLFGIHPATAVGTDLLYAAATKTGGTLVHGFGRTIDWRVVGRLASGSVPAAALTLLVLAEFPVGSGGSRLISTALGFALLLTALSLVFRQQIVQLYAARVGEMDADRTAKLTVATGAALGVLVSLSSVGAGAVGVTALLMLYPRLPIVRIVGSDIAHAVPLTLIAGVGHWFLGSVDWPLLGALLCGSLPGIFIGSHFAGRIPDRVLRPILAATLVVVSGKLIF